MKQLLNDNWAPKDHLKQKKLIHILFISGAGVQFLRLEDLECKPVTGLRGTNVSFSIHSGGPESRYVHSGWLRIACFREYHLASGLWTQSALRLVLIQVRMSQLRLRDHPIYHFVL